MKFFIYFLYFCTRKLQKTTIPMPMNRFFMLCLMLLPAVGGQAQRYVLHVDQKNGLSQRIDARQITSIKISNTTDCTSMDLYNGETNSWNNDEINDLTFEKLPPRLVHYTQSVENEPVHRFITSVQYDLDDYEYTDVLDYAVHPLPYDRPHPLTIRIERGHKQGGEYLLLADNMRFEAPSRYELTGDSVEIWNVTPGDKYFYRIVESDGKTIAQEGTANVTGQVRMIYAPSVCNIRDFGGWPVEGGGHIRYGRLYRGAKFHDSKAEYLSTEDSLRLRELNIKCEFDLRGSTEAAGGNTANYYSRLGRDVDYRINGHGMYAYVNAVAVYPEYIRYGWNLIRNHVLNGDPTYIHCSHGCDRMGTWAMIILGVCGVSENDLNLDYELSAFAPKESLWRYRNMHQITPDYDFRNTMAYIKSLEGETLRDKFEHFLTKKCGITKSDVTKLRETLITND